MAQAAAEHKEDSVSKISVVSSPREANCVLVDEGQEELRLRTIRNVNNGTQLFFLGDQVQERPFVFGRADTWAGIDWDHWSPDKYPKPLGCADFMPHPTKTTTKTASKKYCWNCCVLTDAGVEVKLQCCQGCKTARYCSRVCQKKHWAEEHKTQCKKLNDLRKRQKDPEYIEEVD